MNIPKRTHGKSPVKNSSVVRGRLTATAVYKGPIPPSSEFGRYEQILPGAADRILSMAEKQSNHRQSMETKMLEANIKAERNGQIFGFAVFTIAIAAGFSLLCLGRDVAGITSLLGSVGSIVWLFIYNRESMKKELKDKHAETEEDE